MLNQKRTKKMKQGILTIIDFVRVSLKVLQQWLYFGLHLQDVLGSVSDYGHDSIRHYWPINDLGV
jgi:hypothetical protein